MLSLIAKDFKLMFSKSGNRLNRLLSLFFNIVISLLFVAIETFIFINIMKKISIYPGANLIFFIIFLAVITVLLTIVCIFSGQKLFFNEEDNNQLSHLPISNEKKILSKLFFLIITMYVLNLIFSFPLFIAYGQMFNKRLFYFYTSLYYPVLVSILEIGIALIFIYPVKLLLDYLKKHILIQSIVLIIISFGLCFVYSKILNVFIDLVANNEMNLLFTSESIEVANKISKCLIPINYLVNSFVNGNGLIPFICIALGIFIIGLILIFIFYNHFVNFTIENKLNNKKHQIKLSSINKALIKKELILLFRNSNNLFSFTGLLIVEPFLIYLVVKAINTIFTTGTMSYVFATIPNFLMILDIVIILLMSVIISSGANNFIQNEDKSLRIIKIIPINPLKQLFIKTMIPFIASSIFLFISYLILFITRTISYQPFLFGFIVNFISLGCIYLISLYEELKIKHNQQRNSLISNIYTYLIPVVITILGLITTYFKINIYLILTLILLISVILSLPFVIKMKSRLNNLFLDMEVKN